MQYGYANKKHEEFPPMVIVSIVNICNLKCQHCFWPKLASMEGYRGNMMSWEHWKKVIDEMSYHTYSVLNLGTDGEPLMHTDFIKMLRYAKSQNIFPINMTTNGILLKGQILETIINEELIDTINVSLDAFTTNTFVKIRGGKGSTFSKIKENVINAYKLKTRYKKKIKIMVNIIDQPLARSELKDFQDYWNGKVDLVITRKYYTATAETGGTGPDITGDQDFQKTDRWPCTLFWRRITITDDGGIQYCIDDWLHKSRLGHLDQNSIKDIWTSKTYNKLREYHLKGQQHKNPYCADCTEWQGMTWDFDYFVAMEKMIGKQLL